jgi:hypothetical protein
MAIPSYQILVGGHDAIHLASITVPKAWILAPLFPLIGYAFSS